MLGYIIRRVLAIFPVMLIVAIFVFLLLRLTPGDPAAIIAGDMATPEQLERIREAMGLNQPIHTQFITWIGRLLQGDLGTSLISGTPVLTMVGQRIFPTINLALLTIVIAVAIAVPMGVLAAWRHRSFVDYAVMSFSVLGFSVPVFVIGYLFILVFSINLGWLPVQGYASPTENGLAAFLYRAILPALTLEPADTGPALHDAAAAAKICATLIENPVSIAPGFTLGNVHVMAGVPNVFQAMVASVLLLMEGQPPIVNPQKRSMLDVMRDVYQLPPEGYDYFVHHASSTEGDDHVSELEDEHATVARELLRRYANTPELQDQCVRMLGRALDLRHAHFDAMLRNFYDPAEAPFRYQDVAA